MEGTPAFPRDFPQVFADALERRGVSLAWLHAHLAARGHRVSPAALSYWRSGRSQPERSASREALVEIERLLRVAPGTLTGRLGPSRRPGPRPGEKSVRELFADAPGVMEALHGIGFEGLYDELVEQLRHLTIDIDASVRPTTIQVRALMQARHDGARRTPVIVTLDEAGRAPRFRPVAWCSLGRQVLDEDAGGSAVELVVDRPLQRDESCLMELCVELPEPATDTRYDHYAARRMAELLVWVRFDPARVPSRVERFTVVEGVEDSEEVVLGTGSTAHALARGFGPGLLGLRWTW
jgi:hypothetical protein